MPQPWRAIPILCIALVLFVIAVSAGEPLSADDNRATTRASTSAAGSPLVQAAMGAPVGAGQPTWIGLAVLVFGGLIAGLWLMASALLVLRALGDLQSSAKAERPTPSSWGTQAEAPQADGL